MNIKELKSAIRLAIRRSFRHSTILFETRKDKRIDRASFTVDFALGKPADWHNNSILNAPIYMSFVIGTRSPMRAHETDSFFANGEPRQDTTNIRLDTRYSSPTFVVQSEIPNSVFKDYKFTDVKLPWRNPKNIQIDKIPEYFERFFKRTRDIYDKHVDEVAEAYRVKKALFAQQSNSESFWVYEYLQAPVKKFGVLTGRSVRFDDGSIGYVKGQRKNTFKSSGPAWSMYLNDSISAMTEQQFFRDLKTSGVSARSVGDISKSRLDARTSDLREEYARYQRIYRALALKLP